MSLARGRLTLGAPNTFARDWLLDHHIEDVRASVHRIAGREIRVDVVTIQTDQPSLPGLSPVGEASDRTTVIDRAAEQTVLSEAGDELIWRPNPRYRFQDFVVWPGNRLAHAAAQSVAEKPGDSYNPLFIYGGSGLGKTHLLHAIAHEVLAAGRRVVYVTSETFANELITAIRERRTDQFRSRYRYSEVLLVDDVQFIAGKESTQEEFFHTFDALHQAGRQIVLSSDRPPRAMSTLEDRLRSRFDGGLTADIQPPDLETRTAILQSKAAAQRMDVSPEVLALIAQRVQSNIRELEGALNRVIAYARATGRPPSVESALAAMHEVLDGRPRRQAPISDVVAAVCRYYRVDQRALRGKSRAREIVVPRQVAMYLLREEAGLSLAEVGRELGGRDHTTVLHGANKIETEIEASAEIRRDVISLRELIYREKPR